MVDLPLKEKNVKILAKWLFNRNMKYKRPPINNLVVFLGFAACIFQPFPGKRYPLKRGDCKMAACFDLD